jgi:hypothetical protein
MKYVAGSARFWTQIIHTEDLFWWNLVTKYHTLLTLRFLSFLFIMYYVCIMSNLTLTALRNNC